MFKRKKVSGSSFGADGRRVGAPFGPPTPAARAATAATCGSMVPRLGNKPILNGHSSNKLFSSGRQLTVQRAPIMSGLTCHGLSASVLQPFRRPKELRRAKQKVNDEALKTSSLGMKRRVDGMARLLELCGKGIHCKGRSMLKNDEDRSTSGETSEEEEDEQDRPFEPLRVWQSPHQGGEPKGLPTRMYVVLWRSVCFPVK